MKHKLFALQRCDGNPLIAPRLRNKWEEKATFNPGGLLEDDRFHLFYRAVDASGSSSIGYAAITRDMETAERPDHPIVVPEHEWEELGCEDPRITRISNTYYMLYTAYSRRGPRIAAALSRDRRQFIKMGVIGPDLADKDAVLLSERIDGKLVMFHRIEPSIQIAYFDAEEFEMLCDPSFRCRYWMEYLNKLDTQTVIRPKEWWEKSKIGIGPPPIKTPEGWLIIYHGVDERRIYRVGVALADLDDPSRIIARSRIPILSPEKSYERYGCVENIVFPQTAMIMDGILYIFYGAADTVCCLAVAPLEELLDWLAQERDSKA